MSTTLGLVLAADPSGEGAKAGPWGLAIILLLCVGCYFLFKSMSKHLRRVREQFPDEEHLPTAGGTRTTHTADKPIPTSLVKSAGSADAPVQPAAGAPSPDVPE